MQEPGRDQAVRDLLYARQGFQICGVEKTGDFPAPPDSKNYTLSYNEDYLQPGPAPSIYISEIPTCTSPDPIVHCKECRSISPVGPSRREQWLDHGPYVVLAIRAAGGHALTRQTCSLINACRSSGCAVPAASRLSLFTHHCQQRRARVYIKHLLQFMACPIRYYAVGHDVQWIEVGAPSGITILHGVHLTGHAMPTLFCQPSEASARFLSCDHPRAIWLKRRGLPVQGPRVTHHHRHHLNVWRLILLLHSDFPHFQTFTYSSRILAPVALRSCSSIHPTLNSESRTMAKTTATFHTLPYSPAWFHGHGFCIPRFNHVTRLHSDSLSNYNYQASVDRRISTLYCVIHPS